MAERDCLVIVLAAGVGLRMKSLQAKVLHRLAGRTLLAHVLGVAAEAGGTRIAVVSGPDQPQVRDETLRVSPGAEIFIQSERLGTAHAVLAARAALERGPDNILVLFGDTPLVRADTLRRAREAISKGAAVAVLGFYAADPGGYGRLIVEDGDLIAIREHKDATPAEREIRFCNGGLMALRGDVALSLLEAIDDRNEQKEFYLTDAVHIARERGLRAVALETPEAEIQGVNSRAQLAQAETVFQQHLRAAALEGGATLVAPETVFLSADTVIGRDVVIEPHVVFGPGVVVEDDAVIHAFSHIEGARIGRGASVGPFARLRPGAVLGERSRIGNFVEVKATTVEAGAKANHLAYLGDARIGQGANVGAGTITCNYDGFEKHKTDIGAGAFIGSNSSLVAPVRIGDGAYVGSGSVITRNVPDDGLAVARGQQVVKEGWASRFRTLKSALKKKPAGD